MFILGIAKYRTNSNRYWIVERQTPYQTEQNTKWTQWVSLENIDTAAFVDYFETMNPIDMFFNVDTVPFETRPTKEQVQNIRQLRPECFI